MSVSIDGLGLGSATSRFSSVSELSGVVAVVTAATGGVHDVVWVT